MHKIKPFVIRDHFPAPGTYDEGLDPQLVAQLQHGKVAARNKAVAGQIAFMQRFHETPFVDLREHLDEAIYVGVRKDPVVNNPYSFVEWQPGYGYKMRWIEDTRRPADSHAAGPKFPSFFRNLLEENAVTKEQLAEVA